MSSAMSVLRIQNGCSDASSKMNSIPRSRGRSRRNIRPRARCSSVRATSTCTTQGPRDVSNRTPGCGMSFPWAGEAPPRHEPARSSAMKSGPRRIGRDRTPSRRAGALLPPQAIIRAAELSEELLVPVRGKALLHRVQIVLVQVELATREAGRARSALPRARLRAVRSRGPRSREASEALALAGAEVQVLAARLRPELRPAGVLQVTGRAEVGARASGSGQRQGGERGRECAPQDRSGWTQRVHAGGKLVPSATAARGCPAALRLPCCPRHAPVAAVPRRLPPGHLRPRRRVGRDQRRPEAALAAGEAAGAVGLWLHEHRRSLPAAVGRGPARHVSPARGPLGRPGRRRPGHLGDAGAGHRQARVARAHHRVAPTRVARGDGFDRSDLRKGGVARRRAGALRDLPGRRPGRRPDRDRGGQRRAAHAHGRDRPAGVPGRQPRAHRAGGWRDLCRARAGRRADADACDGLLDGATGALLVPPRNQGRPMIAPPMYAALALLAAATTSSTTSNPTSNSNATPTATAVSEPAPASRQAPAETVAMNELPALANDPAVRIAMRGTPASLPPVTAQIFRIGGRLEAQPMFQFSIGDPFFRSILLGLRIEQHLDERWSLAAHALGGASLLSAPIEVCTDSSCSSPEAGRLRSTPGDIRMMSGVEVGWAPIYGKLSLAGEKTIHFDAYVSAGPEILLERIAPDAVSGTASRWALGGRVAIGERIFFSNNFLLRLGASQVLYSTRVRGHAEWERKLSLEMGVAWLFGGR